jgi:hypothetical protein
MLRSILTLARSAPTEGAQEVRKRTTDASSHRTIEHPNEASSLSRLTNAGCAFDLYSPVQNENSSCGVKRQAGYQLKLQRNWKASPLACQTGHHVPRMLSKNSFSLRACASDESLAVVATIIGFMLLLGRKNAVTDAASIRRKVEILRRHEAGEQARKR